MSHGTSDGWQVTTIGAVCEVNPNKPRLRDVADSTVVMFIPMAAVDEGRGEVTQPETRTLGDVRTKSYRTFTSGDVLFAKITPCMENGKVAVVPEIQSRFGFGSTEFHVVRPGPAVDAEYLWLFLRQESYRREAEQHMTGSVGQARVPASFLAETKLPLPPLEVQREIVKALRYAISRTMSSSAHLEKSRHILNRLRSAVLPAASPGVLTIEGVAQGTPTAAIGDLIATLDQGWSPQCLNRPARDDGEWGVIKTTAVQPLQFQPHENKALPSHLSPRPALAVVAGDLLVTRAGPRSRVGITCLVTATPQQRLMICDKVYRLRVDESRVLPTYLELALNERRILLAIDDMKTGTSESGMNLTQGGFMSLKVPVPPLDTQRAMVERATHLLQSTAELARTIDASSRRVERTAEAVLAKAFRGDLSDNGGSE
jgi:type I restriction enzyme S subunit